MRQSPTHFQGETQKYLCGIPVASGQGTIVPELTSCKNCIRKLYVLEPATDGAEVTKGHCGNCGQKIKTQIFLGGDYCCDDCRKALGQ